MRGTVVDELLGLANCRKWNKMGRSEQGGANAV
jgi:hypothetical protein